ncbi:unnamed protein product [Penicillium camemberti]|uniref:Str. FM013 n=1 Tax=Penicillium camemberti (strain FM 013) TaxID=1429867 RepID=A0A0G4PRN6_PENC3|nr:unnamed protein product [Penicillium camemberti]
MSCFVLSGFSVLDNPAEHPQTSGLSKSKSDHRLGPGWVVSCVLGYCKARRVRVDPEYFDDAVQEEWYTKYLPVILDPEDDETYYYPWLWFVLSKGI